jgi:outer membrane usher protein FimD/PapC
LFSSKCFIFSLALLALWLAGAERLSAREGVLPSFSSECFFNDDCDLLSEAETREGEFYAEILLNGHAMAGNELIQVDSDGVLWLSKDAMTNGGVLQRYSNSEELPEEDFYNISEIPGVSAEFDSFGLSVSVRIEPEYRQQQEFFQGERHDLASATQPSTGGHVKYRFDVTASNLTGEQERNFRFNYKLDPKVQLGFGYLKAGFYGTVETESSSGNTGHIETLHYDRLNIKTKTRAKIGLFRPNTNCWLWDCPRGQILGASLKSLGLNYASVSLRNGLVYTGFTETPGTTIEFVVNGTVIDRFVSDSGPWRLETSLLGLGAKDVIIRETRPDGTIEEEEQRVFNSSIDLLKPKKSQFSVVAGFKEVQSLDFSDFELAPKAPFVHVGADYGLNEKTTLHGFAHVEEKGQAVGFGATRALGKKGVLDFAATFTRNEGNLGYKLNGIYSLAFKGTRVSTFSSFQDQYFDSSSGVRLGREFRVGLDISCVFEGGITLSGALDYVNGATVKNSYRASGGLSLPTKIGRLHLSGRYYNDDGEEDYRMNVSLSKSFGKKERRHNLSSQSEFRQDSFRTRNQYSSAKIGTNGLSYGITQSYDEISNTSSSSFRGHARLAKRKFDLFADAKVTDGRLSTQIGIEGGVALYGKKINVIRHIDRGGVLIDTGYEGNKIYFNQASLGKTGEDGLYFDQRIRAFAEATYLTGSGGLPDGYGFEKPRIKVSPLPGAVYYFNPNAKLKRNATFTLVDSSNESLPSGWMLTTVDGEIIGLIGLYGLGYIDELPKGQLNFNAIGTEGERCSFKLPVEDEAQNVFLFDEISCS